MDAVVGDCAVLIVKSPDADVPPSLLDDDCNAMEPPSTVPDALPPTTSTAPPCMVDDPALKRTFPAEDNVPSAVSPAES